MDLLDTKLYVGVIGTRRRDTDADHRATQDAFLKILSTAAGLQWRARGGIVIVSGGCPQGGDRFAEMIAEEYRLELILHRPDKKAYLDVQERWRSTRQNYARNELVARDSRDVLIACVSPDRTGGTEDTIKRYRRIHGREPILV